MSKLANVGAYLILAAAIALPFGSQAKAEVELSAVATLPLDTDNTQSFLKTFVEKVNGMGKGIVTIKFLGGPEVTPPGKAGAALMRGVFDLLHSPAAYYSGEVPEGFAFVGSNRTADEVRANGGFEMLDKIWNSKLNAKLLAWGEPGSKFALYLTEKPNVTAEGVSLKGLKLRSTGTYTPMITALDGVPVAMGASEIYTSLSRGVIQGFGWGDSNVVPLGVKGLVKYRIDPPFYTNNDLVIVNLDKWKSLPKEAQDILTKAAIEYERDSVAFMKALVEKDEAEMKGAGMQIIDLTGDARKKYLSTAHEAMWKRISEITDQSNVLRAKFYKE